MTEEALRSMTKDDPAAELVALLDSGALVGERSAPPGRIPALRVITAGS
jgi:hypothetical protein